MNEHPPDWPGIARTVKEDAAWKCVRCGHPNSRESWHILTVHHLDGDKANCRWWNIPALCQRCHLSIQSRVRMDQRWMFDHSKWFRPYVAGYYAFVRLGEDLTREQVNERIDELLALA